MKIVEPYRPQNHIRIVTATSLFDGHDVSINIMRRILQSSGAEVIHLGHNRSVNEIVECAIQEDVQAIAITSYQGGHIEFFKYMIDMLKERGGSHVKIFGGGGGVILPDEIAELQKYGVSRLYSPDDGMKMGLQGMINELLELADFPRGKNIHVSIDQILQRDINSISHLISAADNFPEEVMGTLKDIQKECKKKLTKVLGITGTGGAGKSSVIDEIIHRYLLDYPKNTIAILSADPSRRRTGGALLGDRIRMNSIDNARVYMRSLATRQSNLALSKHIAEILCIVKSAGFDLIILETSGIGQSSSEVTDYSDYSVYIMTPEFGAATQLEKIDMLDYSDIVVINKSDRRGAEDALRAVKKQFQRNKVLFDIDPDLMPVYGTIASQYNDPGTDEFYHSLIKLLNEGPESKLHFRTKKHYKNNNSIVIIPSSRERYLSEITEKIREYNKNSEEQSELANKLFGLNQAIEGITQANLKEDRNTIKRLEELSADLKHKIQTENLEIISNWDHKIESYKKASFIFKVRDEEVCIDTHTTSLSHQQIPKIALPRYKAWGDILRWSLRENVPGEFPFAAGVYPFKRENEDPIRMFAGEGSPERTNKRFHYLSVGMPALRLSTAYDSVTLYGANPDVRPDVFGKIGNSGVSISCLDDSKKLYSGFDLLDPRTSVSMTINGPAPALVGYFMNTVIDQQCEIYIKNQGLEQKTREKISRIFKETGSTQPIYQGELPEGHNGLGLMLLGVCGEQILPAEVYEKIKNETIAKVRGTVQADILKEDQAQNTCILRTDFALKMMGDIQEYFITNNVRNFYSVSISGYHIAEAGANPITQLALTLANGFTYVEYYLSRGMHIDEFAPNLSFFFSNGLDIEYTVIGRVARTIWAKALKFKYHANDRSQKLKYHIQTSGRSLHAQEIEFNDIRTTLQALNGIYDNCNSLHTNAFDEAITTPTEESVRRAMAIQLIINQELGMAKNQNPLQGSFIIEELTELVEEAVLMEFDRITERGGVLGAMETNYQRSKIQEESLYYERLKHSSELPIIGVNTYLSANGSKTIIPEKVTRANQEEKARQIEMVKSVHKRNQKLATAKLLALKETVKNTGNTFEAILEATKYCSLGQITDTLYEAGGKYRRNM